MHDIDADLEQWLTGVVPRAVAYARSLLMHQEDAGRYRLRGVNLSWSAIQRLFP